MRYNHESYLPIGAFQPILGRMRLHGGGGNPLDTFSDMIGTGGGDTGLLNMIDEGVQGASDVFATVDDVILQPVTAPISQVTSALDEAVFQPITAPISEVGVAIDDAVADVIPGGWGTIAQVAAAATGNPYIIGATSAGVNFARNKDLESAIKAGAISGGTAGITQGLGEAFQLGDLGRAGVSGGIQGGLEYAKTGDLNSALKAGAKGAGMSYAGSQLAPYIDPYLSEIKGDFGKFLQEQGVNLSNFANPSAGGINPDSGMPGEISGPPATAQNAPYNLDQEYIKWAKGMMDQGYSPAKTMTDTGEFVQGSYDNNFSTVPNVRTESALGSFNNEPDLQNVSDVTTNKVPNAQIKENKIGIGSVPFDFDTPVYYDGYVPMTPAQVAAANPNLYPNGQIIDPGTVTYYNLPKEYRGLGEEGINQKYAAANAANVARQNLAISDQANLDAAYTPPYDVNAAIKEQANLDNKYTFAGEDKFKNILKDPAGYATEKAGDVKDYLANKALVTERYLTSTPLSEMPGDLYDAAKDFYKNSSKTDLAMLAAGAYGLANLGGGDDKGKSQAQIDAEQAAAKKTYTYGTSEKLGPNYLLPNKVNASNVYSSATGYRPLTRYAEGGEVQHYGIGGKISDALTRVAQPFEKAIIRPIGEAAPFLKDLAPYAGMAAGAMMGNPAMAAGIGGIASGFGKPGGFDMKRALMGGIAAYGMSNLAGGLEAAGTPEAALPIYPEAPIQPSSMVGSDTMFIPQGPSQAALQSMAKTDLANTPRDMFSLRDTNAMQKGIGNLLQNSNTPAYKDAMAALTNKVGIYNTGVPLIMGTTGMMGVDESNALKQEYDVATAKNKADEDKFKARVATGKKRAQQAVTENPYMFAEGGAINPPDDQTQLANETPMTKLNDQAQMQMASPLQGLGAESQMMSQSAGLGNTLNGVTTNNGISGLFSQLTSNPSNNAIPYEPQGGTPESVILPSYGGNSSPNSIGGSPSMAGGGSGGTGGASGAFPLQGQYGIVKMAAGGMPPRFLSGGGDGMSDSIRANIEGSQEARLADGEFVIPADVVSHLGNGSSKAGANQLYAMMDRVRKARTGNPKQGREIKPTKLMPV